MQIEQGFRVLVCRDKMRALLDALFDFVSSLRQRKKVPKMSTKVLSVFLLALTCAAVSCTRGRPTGPPVEIPNAHFSQTDAGMFGPDAVVLSIPNASEVFLADDRSQLADLPERIGALMKTRKAEEKIIYLRSGRKVPYGKVADAIEQVRAAGVNYIGLAADNAEQLPPTVFEAAILQKLTEADLRYPVTPPPLRNLLASLPQNTPNNPPPPPPPPPRPGATPRALSITQTEPRRFSATERLVVELPNDATGTQQTVLLNWEPIPLADLSQKLAEIFQFANVRWYPVYIRASRERPYEDVIAVIDQIARPRRAQLVLQIDYLDGQGPLLLPRPGTESTRRVAAPEGIPGVVTDSVGPNGPPSPAPKPTKPK